MDTLQSTLELLELSADGIEKMDELEDEFLRDEPIDKPTDLDHRLYHMEFKVLQGRIDELVTNNAPFGSSGLLSSAVVFKDLTPQETVQLQTNAIAVSSIINSILDKFSDPQYIGLACLTIITDDLYQDRVINISLISSVHLSKQIKHSDLNSANSYLFTLEWRKYF